MTGRGGGVRRGASAQRDMKLLFEKYAEDLVSLSIHFKKNKLYIISY